MYDELVENLRESAEWADRLAILMGKTDGDTHAPIMREAADAIAGLEKACEEAYNKGLLESGIAQRAEDEKWLPKWIPVTDTLPKTRDSVLGKKSSKVIVAFRFDDGTQGTDTAHTLNGEWVFEDRITVVARTVTHWIPLPSADGLPELPKEET